MRYDEGIENELRDWLAAVGELKQLIAPRLVREAVKAIKCARREGLLVEDLPIRPSITIQEYL